MFGNAYWIINAPDGSGYTYDLTLNYDLSVLGNISSEANVRLAKSDDNGVTWTTFTSSGTGPGQYQLNTSTHSVTVYGLTAFSLFAITDVDAPLPVELSSFTAKPINRNVVLKWETKSEQNAGS